jgi:hypothetical protein
MDADLIGQLAKAASVPAEAMECRIREDAEFRDMCEDYATCLQMLSEWRSSLPKHVARVEEYRALSRDLRREIVSSLEQRPGSEPQQ